MNKYAAAPGTPEKVRHFHVLKHCCATHLLSKGFGVERVQDWIGHANIQSTMEYAKVTNARRDDMAQQLKETWRWQAKPTIRSKRRLPKRAHKVSGTLKPTKPVKRAVLPPIDAW